MAFKLKLTGETRYPQLDVLRCIAIVLVLGFHAHVAWRGVGVMGPVAYFFEWMGWSGLDLFFVLSGFLISGLLFREIRRNGKLDVRRFIIRRAFKIWPGYFVLVGYSFLKMMHHGWSAKSAFAKIAPNLFHVQNYSLQPWIPHTWSLAVEEHFYLMLPVLLWIAIRARPNKVHGSLPAIPVTAAILGVFCLGLRCYRVLWLHESIRALFPTEVRIDSLFFGVLCGYVFHYRADWMTQVRRFRGALMVGGIVLVSHALCVGEAFRFTLGLTLMYLGYGAILMSLMCADETSGGLWRIVFGWPGKVIGSIGAFSYGIYLWHLDLAIWPAEHWYWARFSGVSGAAMYSAYLATCLVMAIAAGVLATFFVERPGLWLRDRWWPTRARPVTAAMEPVIHDDVMVRL